LIADIPTVPFCR